MTSTTIQGEIPPPVEEVTVSVAEVPHPPSPSYVQGERGERGERDDELPNHVSVKINTQHETPNVANLAAFELSPSPEVAPRQEEDFLEWSWVKKKCPLLNMDYICPDCCCFTCIGGILNCFMAMIYYLTLFALVVAWYVIRYSYPGAALFLSCGVVSMGVYVVIGPFWILYYSLYCFCCFCACKDILDEMKNLAFKYIGPIFVYTLILPLSMTFEIVHMANCLMDLMLFPYMITYAIKLFIAQVQAKSVIFSILSLYQVYQLGLLFILSPYVLTQVLSGLDKKKVMDANKSTLEVHQQTVSYIQESNKPWWWIEELTSQKIIYFCGFKFYHIASCAQDFVELFKQQFCILEFPQPMLGPKKFAFLADLFLHTIPMTLAAIFLPFPSYIPYLRTVRIATGVVSILGGIRYVFEDEDLLQIVVQTGAYCCYVLIAILGSGD
jgi:hypothetical protein